MIMALTAVGTPLALSGSTPEYSTATSRALHSNRIMLNDGSAILR